MDLKLLALVDKQMPRMNKDIINGLAVIQVKEGESYINNIFRCAAESFPPGLKFVDGRRCSPLEQYKELTRILKPSRSFDMTKSDVYMMKYTFTFNGVDLKPRYILLPFVSDGNLFHLKGTLYNITPVIGGKVFNIERGNIFMPTPRIRMGFSQEPIACILNNRVIHSAAVLSKLHNMVKTERSELSPMLLHYILAEFGLTETLLKFFNVTIRLGESELDQLDDDWMIYRSRQMPLVNKLNSYSPVSELRITIPATQHYPLLDEVINTVFYIVDHAVESTSNIEDLNTPMLWLLLLDKFIFKNSTSEKKQYTRMSDHLLSTKMTMDIVTRRILLTEHINCETIFDFFRYIILNYQDIVIHYDVGTMYNKELTTVKHLMYDVVYNIFMAMHKLKELPDNLLTAAKIDTVLMMVMKHNKIFTTMGHGELAPASIATDCKMHNATCNMINHNKANSVGGGKYSKRVIPDQAQLLHPSQTEVGTFQWITSAEPLGRGKLNPFLHFNEKTYIAPRPEHQEDIESLRLLLRK